MSNKILVVVAILVTAFLIFLAPPFASDNPDGLERVAIDNGFLKEDKKLALYDGYNNNYLNLFGAFLTFGAVSGVGYFLYNKRPPDDKS